MLFIHMLQTLVFKLTKLDESQCRYMAGCQKNILSQEHGVIKTKEQIRIYFDI